MSHQNADDNPLYRDPARPVAERVRDLLARMTLEEKIAQLGSAWVYELFEDTAFSEQKARAVMGNGIGQITRIGGASNLAPAASAELANRIQAFLLKGTRLGIPATVHEECCSGYMAMGATCFPQIIGVASTWEPDLVEAMTDVIRVQMRAVGAHHALAPVLDVVRDPRWGRVEETFGEDTYLVSRMGVAYVSGLQGPDPETGIVATGKHFVAYGNTEGGMNWAPAHVGPRELLGVFTAPFAAAIKLAGMGSIMNAYHELDGIPCASSPAIFRDLLREQLGFTGVVVSDYFAIDMLRAYHRIAKDKQEAALLALAAGIDVELPSTDCYGDPLRQAVEAGAVDIALIDEAVRRVLEQKFRQGVFENPYVDAGRAAEVFDTPPQRELARKIAQQSIVLLKNAGGLLPLRKTLGSIAVVGPNADSVRNLVGDYSYPAHMETLAMMGQSNVFDTAVPETIEVVETSVPITSVLEAVRAKVGPDTTVRYARGCDVLGDSTEGIDEAVRIADQSDVAIVVVGDKAGLTLDCTSGEARDRAELGLPGVQEALVRAICETGTPLVLVLVNGRPLAIPWIAEHVPAIVEAWLPGEEGANAVADVLFGDCNPGGKLPMTFPRAVGQVPVYYNHPPSGGRSHWFGDYVETSASPLFAFGHGLSYTRFDIDNLRVAPAQARAGETVTVSVDVSNVGERAGDEVVQLYIHHLASVTRPVKALKGFKRVSLEPGASRTVTFHLAVNQLAFYNREMAFVVEPGAVEVMVGSASDDIRCTASFEITGEVTDVAPNEAFFSAVAVN